MSLCRALKRRATAYKSLSPSLISLSLSLSLCLSLSLSHSLSFSLLSPALLLSILSLHHIYGSSVKIQVVSCSAGLRLLQCHHGCRTSSSEFGRFWASLFPGFPYCSRPYGTRPRPPNPPQKIPQLQSARIIFK